MDKNPKVLVVAGEASGDLHASKLVAELKKIVPTVEVYGIGGKHLAGVGARLLKDIRELSTYGLFEVLKQIPRLAKIFFRLLCGISRERPDAVMLVDYPDFNMPLARAIRWRYGTTPKIFYYIAPQVWIWRKGRAKKLAQRVDKLVVVLPFEKPLFENLGAEVHFVGHPLLDDRAEIANMRIENPFDAGKKKIALLPGSRRGEIKTYMPEFMKAAEILTARDANYQFAIIKASSLHESDFDPYLKETSANVILIEGSTRGLLKYADFAVTALGTATLETALACVPAVFIGKVAPLSYYAAINILGMENDYYSLANYILGRPAFPELIQDDFTGGKIAEVAIDILSDERALNALRKAGEEVRIKLDVKVGKDIDGLSASRRAAQVLANMISEK